jgi:2-polyprenyl-6-methoxyphenol hydroxylase-like FAD-dependent oxidoreductase
MVENASIFRTQVAIFGGGPVGMLLALFLNRYGVRSVIFNTESQLRMHPKGNTHNSRTMEHYRRLGISGAIRKLGLPPDHPKDAAYFTRLSGWEIAHYRMASETELARLNTATRPTDQIPEPLQRANQMYVENFLLSHVRPLLAWSWAKKRRFAFRSSRQWVHPATPRSEAAR